MFLKENADMPLSAVHIKYFGLKKIYGIKTIRDKFKIVETSTIITKSDTNIVDTQLALLPIYKLYPKDKVKIPQQNL